MLTLHGRRIAVLERRQSRELERLIRGLGGEPVSAPAINEVISHDDFNAFFDGVTRRQFSIAVFLNGAGPASLLAEAERRGRLNDIVQALREMTVVTRGAKPMAVLKRYDLRSDRTTARPHTTIELLRTLSAIDVGNRGVVLVHHGERNVAVAAELRRRGARLGEVCPYEWMLPDDLGPITSLVRGLLARELDAVIFTNRVQCRHLFQVAAEMHRGEGLARSLNHDVVVGAVGPVCAGALARAGVTADIVPTTPSMPALVDAVAKHLSLRAGS